MQTSEAVEDVHDSDIVDDDDDDCAGMTNEHTCNKTLCCGSSYTVHSICTCTPRGTSAEMCQIISAALTSSDSRDSLDMPSIQELLVGFDCLSFNDIQNLSYFDDSRISLLEEYIQRLILTVKGLKELPRTSTGIQFND